MVTLSTFLISHP